MTKVKTNPSRFSGRHARAHATPEDPGVQQRVVAEQHDVAAPPGRRQHRREKAARRAEHRQRERLLPHGERARCGHEAEQQRERDRRGQHVVQPEGGEHGQVQDADAAALQAQAVAGTGMPQSPADAEQDGAGQRDAGQTQFDRQRERLGGVLGEERDAEEEHHHADAHHGVAAEQPALPCRGFRRPRGPRRCVRGCGSRWRGRAGCGAGAMLRRRVRGTHRDARRRDRSAPFGDWRDAAPLRFRRR